MKKKILVPALGLLIILVALGLLLGRSRFAVEEVPEKKNDEAIPWQTGATAKPEAEPRGPVNTKADESMFNEESK